MDELSTTNANNIQINISSSSNYSICNSSNNQEPLPQYLPPVSSPVIPPNLSPKSNNSNSPTFLAPPVIDNLEPDKEEKEEENEEEAEQIVPNYDSVEESQQQEADPNHSSSSSSFQQRAGGYRHSFHRRHNSAKQKSHLGSNYPSYYNYKTDDTCSTDTLEQSTLKIDIPLPRITTPTSILAARRLSKCPSPKQSISSTGMFYEQQQQFQKQQSSQANSESNNRNSFVSNNSNFHNYNETEGDQQQTISSHPRLNQTRSNRSGTISRETSVDGCCCGKSRSDKRRYSTSSSITSHQSRCCNVDEEFEEEFSCRGGGFCGSICTKTFLISINFIFFVVGWTMMAGGVWVHLYREESHFGVLLRDNPTSPLLVSDRIAVLLIVSGAVVSLVGFLGCCGACTESVCFLGFYAVLLLVFLIVQVVVVVLLSSYQKKIERNLAISMFYQVKYEYNVSSDLSVTLSWDKIQSTMNCCGAVSPLDYYESAWYNTTLDATGKFVPVSCCRPSLPENDPYDHNKNSKHSDYGGEAGGVGSFKEDFYNEEMKRYENNDYYYPYNNNFNSFRYVRSDMALRKRERSKRHFRVGSLHKACNSSCYLKPFHRTIHKSPTNNFSTFSNFSKTRIDKMEVFSKKRRQALMYFKQFQDLHFSRVPNKSSKENSLNEFAKTVATNERSKISTSIRAGHSYPRHSEKIKYGEKSKNDKKIKLNNDKNELSINLKVTSHNYLSNFSHSVNNLTQHQRTPSKAYEVPSNDPNKKTTAKTKLTKLHSRVNKKQKRSARSLQYTDDGEKEYVCQLEALRLRRPETPAPFKQLYSQGCHLAILELLRVHAPALVCVIFLDILQVINLFYACVLISIVRKKHSDYSWCEEEERI